MEERCAGTLLAWLVRNGSDSPAENVWEDPDALRAPERIRDILELARRFSLHVEGMPLLYNLLVAERRRDVLDSDEDESIDEFRAGLAEWAAREADEDRPFEPDALWQSGRPEWSDVFRIPNVVFIESWSRRIAELGPRPGSPTTIGCGRWSPNASSVSRAHGRG